MAVLRILQYPLDNAALRRKAMMIETITAEVEGDIQDIVDTAKNTPNLGGLAATQVGILKRIFVGSFEKDGAWRVYINPEIINPQGQTNTTEACASVPGGVREAVRRAETVTLRYMNTDGQYIEEHLDGYAAKCAQHEIEHLDGVLFIDHLSKIRRKMAEKKIERYLRKNKS